MVGKYMITCISLLSLSIPTSEGTLSVVGAKIMGI